MAAFAVLDPLLIEGTPMTACRRMLAAIAGATVLMTGPALAQGQQQARPVYKSAVDLVSVAAVVRDKRGRFVRGLGKDDFIVEEAGVRRAIEQFQAEDDAPVRVALLFDVSGSMRVAAHIEEARQAARQVLASLRLSTKPVDDEAAVFSFDMNLQSLQPFTADPGAIEQALSRVSPYGQTSLYDAIGLTAKQVAATAPGDPHRRAVIVLTDGIDTSSEMTPEQVAAIAAAIDVPVYVVAVVSPLDHAGTPPAVDGPAGEREGVLRTLARWTGGDLFVTSAPAQQSLAARQIVDELRHQYVLAFSSSKSGSGWRALSVRVKDKDATVRARSGYASAPRVGS
jgi:Ca-activated chloride channel family protein